MSKLVELLLTKKPKDSQANTKGIDKTPIGVEFPFQNSKDLIKTDLSKPVVENYTFTHNNAIEVIGDKMYFSPVFFLAETKNIFTQEKREYPVDFIFPNQDKHNISFTIPEGYAIETIPQSKSVAMIDGICNFTYLISNTENKFQIVYTLDINEAIISPEYYEVLKNFFKEIVDKHSEKIVLKKI